MLTPVLRLGKGAHETREKGMCVMEAAAYVANLPHSDRPECVSPVIGAFVRNWNNAMNDDDRQMLAPYTVRILGTNTGAADDETRAWLATDWMVRTQTPMWLRLAGLTDEAAGLEALIPLTNGASALPAYEQIEAVRPKTAAARAAAWGAALDAALDATWAAAWAAAGAAALDAAWDAAWAAAGAAAWDAAGAAARAVAGDAASWGLRPTVVALQSSALGLLDHMIEVGERRSVPLIKERVALVLEG